jgi:hypothetical protein
MIRMIISKRMRWTMFVARRGRKGMSLGLKSQTETPLERPRCGWEDNIKTGLTEMGWA